MICPSCKTPSDAFAEVCFVCGKDLATLSEGTVVAGRYEIGRLLGRGGMGLVYRAYDRTLDETVALKTLRPHVAADPDIVRRFRAEIRMARRIRHRNVCAIHDYGEDGGLLYISMEFVDGVDLKHVVREEGGFSAEEGFSVAVQVAKGLEAIHEAGVVHRDLKSHNVMRDRRGVVKLLDFGVAKQLGAETGLTTAGQIVGTPEYMSPEQVRGGPLDTRSDLYALGVVLFEVFTGDVPFRGDTPVATIYKHLQEEPPLAGPRAAGLPPALVPVLRRCLAKDSADRYATAGEVVDALRAARAVALPDATPTPSLLRADLEAVPARGGPPAAAGRVEAPAAPAPADPVPAPPPRQAPSPASTLEPPPSAGRRLGRPAPAPEVAAARRAPAPAPRSLPASAGPSAGARALPWVLFGVGVVLLLGSLATWQLARLLRPPAAVSPEPPAAAAPAPVPSPRPAATIEGEVTTFARGGPPPTVEIPTAPPRPPRRPTPAPATPEPAPPTEPPATTPAVPAVPSRVFVVEPSRVLSGKAARAEVAGFDQGDVSLHQAPEFQGRLEWTFAPPEVRPGDPYSLAVFLVNEGRKARVDRVTVTEITSAGRRGGMVVPGVRELRPGQRAVLYERTGVWPGEPGPWALEVVVTTSKGDACRGRLTAR